MANESAAQLARQAKHAIDLLKQDVDLLKERFDELDLILLRERVAVLDSHVKKLEAELETNKTTKAEAEEMGGLKSRLTQLEEQKKLGDTRAFQFIVLFIGGLLTLAINIALLFLKK